MDSRSVTVEIVQAGQPGPYKDHIYEGYITFSVPEGQMWASKFGSSLETVKPYIQIMLGSFVENPEWWQPRLKLCEQVSPLRWHVIVTQPYLD